MMTGMTKNDWKLVGIGAVVAGALIIPVFQLIRIFAGNMGTRFVGYEGDNAIGDGRPVRSAGNIINICIMGMMATTKVQKVIPGARRQVETNGREHSIKHKHAALRSSHT